MFKLVLEKAEEPEITLPTSTGSSKKTKEFQKNIYFCFIDYANTFDCEDHHELWKILKEMGIPDHLTCLLRHLYAGQEATIRTGHGTTGWFQEEKETTEDEMVGWHHQLNGCEFEQALGVGDGQGRLACCSCWGCKVRHD